PRVEGIDVAASRAANLRQVAKGDVDVVEQVGDETFGRRGRLAGFRRGGTGLGRGPGFRVYGIPADLLHREFGDFLRLALVEKLEILPGETADGLALLVADHYRNRDHVHLGAKRGGSAVRRPLGGVLSRMRRAQEYR